MVQARPNRAVLRGRVERVGADASCPPGWSAVELTVQEADDVGDMANMLSSLVGRVVSIHVDGDDVAREAIGAGDGIELVARRVSPRRIVADRNSLRRLGS